jgi:glycosyltransferase involved in cell wall biosynthesis
MFDSRPHPVAAALRDGDVQVYEVRLGPRSYLAERRAIRGLCRTFRPDVVHTHGYRIDVVERDVAARLRIPTVTTVHGPSMNGGLKGAIYEWMQWTNYRRFDAVVAVSAALRDRTLAEGVVQERLHLIRNAWGALSSPLPRAEARQRLGISRDAVVIGWVGRLIPVKGGDIFLDAVRRLPEPRPVVAMIGHGIEAQALARKAHELGVADAVRFYPDIADAGRYFAAFDAYVLSSRSEGLPVVLLEAMAARVPIVAARVGGVPEAVTPDDALLVAPEDPDALAAAIMEALRDPVAGAVRARNAARRLDEEFSYDPWLDRYEDVYRGVVGAPKTPIRIAVAV